MLQLVIDICLLFKAQLTLNDLHTKRWKLLRFVMALWWLDKGAWFAVEPLLEQIKSKFVVTKDLEVRIRGTVLSQLYSLWVQRMLFWS